MTVFVHPGIEYLRLRVCICKGIHGEEHSVLSTFFCCFICPPLYKIPEDGVQYRARYCHRILPSTHTKHSTWKGLWHITYTLDWCFYKPRLFLCLGDRDQAGRWSKLCETARKEPGKSCRIFACSKSPFVALERLFGKLIHGRDCVCLKTLPVRDNCFRSLKKAM